MSVATKNFELGRTLRRWDLRRRLQETLIWLPRGILIGVIVALGITLASYYQPWLLRDELVQVALVASGAGGILTLVWT